MEWAPASHPLLLPQATTHTSLLIIQNIHRTNTHLAILRATKDRSSLEEYPWRSYCFFLSKLTIKSQKGWYSRTKNHCRRKAQTTMPLPSLGDQSIPYLNMKWDQIKEATSQWLRRWLTDSASFPHITQISEMLPSASLYTSKNKLWILFS